MNWKKRAKELKLEKGLSWKMTAEAIQKEFFSDEELSKVYERIRSYIRTTKEYKLKNKKDDNYTKTIQYKADGTYEYDKLIEICEDEEITPELIMQKHNIDPKKWKVISYRNNYWHSQIKGGKRLVMYQSRLTVKPLDESEKTLQYIDEYMQTKQFKYDKPLTKAIQYDPDGEVLEINVPDLHSGLLAWRKETGADYDVKIAKDYFFKAIYDITDRCKGKKLKKILFVLLGDLIHIDNNNQTTTKGTFQQSDGRLEKIVETTEDMLIDSITILGDIAPVEVIHLKGNHDEITGYMLIRAVANAFRKDNNITFDTDPNPNKYRKIGVNLIGWCHGDMPKKNLSNWLQQEARVEFGQTLFSEVHVGHAHVQETREYKQTEEGKGVIVRQLPALCNSSYWEHQQGYGKHIRTMMCFVWNERTGLREMWFNNIL